MNVYKTKRDGTIVHLRMYSKAEVAALNHRRANRKVRPSATWKELHTRYLTWGGKEDWAWLLDFLNRVANTGNCKCRENAVKWVFLNQPDWADPFSWSVKFHNSVNVRLRKPVLTVETARAIYAKSGPAHHA
jgi:hypothetical protein